MQKLNDNHRKIKKKINSLFLKKNKLTKTNKTKTISLVILNGLQKSVLR
jgi:hypothetical protein